MCRSAFKFGHPHVPFDTIVNTSDEKGRVLSRNERITSLANKQSSPAIFLGQMRQRIATDLLDEILL